MTHKGYIIPCTFLPYKHGIGRFCCNQSRPISLQKSLFITYDNLGKEGLYVGPVANKGGMSEACPPFGATCPLNCLVLADEDGAFSCL